MAADHWCLSLNQSHYHFSAVNKVNGRVCNISINGPKMIRNFIREYRREIREAEFSKDILRVEFNLYGSTIGLFFFQMFNTAKEGVFKFLPYRIKDLPDLYRFTNHPASPHLFVDRFELDATEGCLQDAVLDRMREHYLQEINTTEENTTGTHAADPVSRCADPLWHYHWCLFVESDLEKAVSHIFMHAMTHIDNWFKMIQTGVYKEDREVCALILNREMGDFSRSYKPYTIYECCSAAKAHPYPYEYGLKNEWYCHSPYQVTEILAIISLFLSYITMAVLPLAIKWIPSTQSTDHPNVR